MTINKAVIVTNTAMPDSAIAEKEVISLLNKRGVGFCVFRDGENIDAKDGDLLIVIGGDGTILNAAHSVIDKNIPIFGINTGHLGYLTTTEPEFAIPNLIKVFDGEFTVEERITLSAKIHGKDNICINEALFHRGSEAHLLNVKIEINGHETDTVRGDGLLVSTPTGSTAYNLSAGGPIISPTAVAMALTPICVHSLTSRPLVLSGGDKINLTVLNSSAQVSIDGFANEILHTGESAEVKIGSKKLLLIRTGEKSFYKILRKKLSGK